MPTAIANAVARHFDAMHAAGGVTVTYARGVNSVVLDAVPAVTQYETTQDDGSLVTFQSRDYLIRAADLILAAVEELPDRFDTITEGTEVYEVRSPGGGRAYRYSDQYKTILRVHTHDKNAGD